MILIRKMDGKEPKISIRKKKQLYFESIDHEHCYPESFFQDMMRDEELTEIDVLVAEPDTSDSGYTYCNSEYGVIEKGSCSKADCKSYSPRNGKSGCCRYIGRLYEYGEKVTLRLNNKKL